MCIGVPVKVMQAGDFVQKCHGLNGEEMVNMMLLGEQPVGTWVLNFLGTAREILSEEDAANINKALEGLSEIMNGAETIDVDHYFPGLNG